MKYGMKVTLMMVSGQTCVLRNVTHFRTDEGRVSFASMYHGQAWQSFAIAEIADCDMESENGLRT